MAYLSIKIWSNIRNEECLLFSLYYTLYSKSLDKIRKYIVSSVGSHDDYLKMLDMKWYKPVLHDVLKNINIELTDYSEQRRRVTKVVEKLLHIVFAIIVEDVPVLEKDVMEYKTGSRDGYIAQEVIHNWILENFHVKFPKSHKMIPTDSNLINKIKNISNKCNYGDLLKTLGVIENDDDVILENIDFEHVNLAGADFSKMELNNCVFHGKQIKDLSKSMKETTLKNCTLVFDKISQKFIEGCLIHCLE